MSYNGLLSSLMATTEERFRDTTCPRFFTQSLVTVEQTKNNYWISRLFSLFAAIDSGVSLCVLVIFKTFNLPITKHYVIYLL